MRLALFAVALLAGVAHADTVTTWVTPNATVTLPTAKDYANGTLCLKSAATRDPRSPTTGLDEPDWPGMVIPAGLFQLSATPLPRC